jgi:hypothetical protein
MKSPEIPSFAANGSHHRHAATAKKMPLPEPHVLPDDQIYLPNLFLHSKVSQTLKKAI